MNYVVFLSWCLWQILTMLDVWYSGENHWVGTIWKKNFIYIYMYVYPIQWVPGVKMPGREAHHSPPCSAEVTNWWSYTPTPQYIFMAWCLVKHRDFTFTLTSVILMLSKKLIGLILCLRIFHEAKLKIVGPNFIRKVEMKMYIQTRRN